MALSVDVIGMNKGQRETLVTRIVSPTFTVAALAVYPENKGECIAMLDFLSRENDIPLCDEYDDLRLCKLEKPIYPAGIRAVCAAMKNDTAMKQAADMAIPEFARFNIIENEVRNVV